MTALFQPFIRGLRNRFCPGGRVSPRTGAIALFGAALFAALYLVSLKVVGYFHSQSELGVILSLKIFQMAWMIMFTMLIFSAMVSGVSALFLSSDNEILCAAPVTPARLYRMRYLTATLYSSWMMVIFSLPVFGAYGTVFEAGPLYWPLLLVAVLSTALTASGIGLGATVLLVNIFPAKRTKDIVMYLSLLFGVFLYLIIRLIRPEDLADPDKFPDFLEYLSMLQTPATPLLPPSWAANLLSGYVEVRQTDLLQTGLLLLTPPVIYFTGEWIMERWFLPGFSKAQESFGGSRSFGRRAYRPSPLMWSLRKELKMFLRDSSEWSQLFLIGALVVVYLYNFKVLPLDRAPMPIEYLANIIAYANIGLTGFLATSLSARFVFPSIGAEGAGFGLIMTAPLSLGRYMLHKYLFYALPFTLLTLLLITVSNHLLQIEGPMHWISIGAGLIITWSVVAMALGFGAMHADFRAENRAAVLGGFGAILYMFCALSFELICILLGSVPAYRLAKSWMLGKDLPATSLLVYGSLLGLMMALAAGVSYACIRQGMRKVGENFH